MSTNTDDRTPAPPPLSEPPAAERELTWRDIDLSRYDDSWWDMGRSKLVVSLWRWIGMPLMQHLPCQTFFGQFFNDVRVWLLRAFGAKIGKNCVIRAVEVFLPWRLTMGDNCWVGYEANLYTLVPIRIGNNVCISQRAFLCTGGHDPYEPTFGLVIGEITVKDGAWVGASTFVGPGVTLHEGAVAAGGSVVVKDLPAMTICGGNPARPIKPRVLKPTNPPLPPHLWNATRPNYNRQ